MWKDIEHILDQQQGPWCVIRDFDNIVKTQDRVGDKMVTEAEYVDFNVMLDKTGLCEMDNKGRPMYVMWEKLKRLQGIMRTLSKPLQHLKKNILETRNALHKVQPDLSNDRMNDIKNHAKGMHMLQRDDGTKITTHSEISDDVLEYYGGLMGKADSNLIHIDVEAMRNGTQLSMEKRESLIGHVSEH
ncbi:hypothetical protein KIW84_030764 [Lathyrus oleraceus]|uniref:Uncharacterized protein n=1 Tax=Pisum sativum TaxID=3888 RepID=A0A9D5AZE3_PEA|nr:hypothetical protein KIW84_030764 [Pisum sativum]